MRIDDPISYFRGKWSYERRFRDRRQAASGRASGVAAFTRRGDGLRWRESGRLEIDGLSTSTTRELAIVPDEPGRSGWMVRFEDGRPFHPLALDRGDCEVEHPCRADLYRGRIRAETRNLFHTAWEVEGPAKDQLIETTYRRIAEGA